MACEHFRRTALLAAGCALLACAFAAEARAQTLQRRDHTQTLTVDGNILVTGGIGVAGAYQNTVVRVNLETGAVESMTAMGVARASHTATLLPDGRVLVVGGYSTGGGSCGGPCATYEIYTPQTNSWTGLGGLPASRAPDGGSGRFNHTATLLKNGRVLICGGESALGTVRRNCDVFIPSYGGGSDAWVAASYPDLLSARTHHTATLLHTGEVLVAGGFNPALTPNHTPLMERYRPDSGVNGSFTPARPLNEGRAYHSATAMGNGKVLIAGGYNSKNLENNRGYLQTSEIYDPVADQAVVAPLMNARKLGFSATLSPDGKVALMGGYGNVATTYFTPAFVMQDAPSFLTGAGVNTNLGGTARTSRSDLSGGTLVVNLKTQLGTPVTGIIRQGMIILSTPSIMFNGGYAYLTEGQSLNGETWTGLSIDLAGTNVYCETDGTCGWMNRQVTLQQVGGVYGFESLNPTVRNNPITDATGCMAYTPTPISNATVGATIDTSGAGCGGGNDLDNTVQVSGLPRQYINGNISSGTFQLKDGYGEHTRGAEISFNITFSNAWTEVNGTPRPVTQDPAAETTVGMFDFMPNFRDFLGTVRVSTTTNQASPMNGTITMNISRAVLRFVVSRVDVGNMGLNVNISTIIIRTMVFGDLEEYIPADDTWRFSDKVSRGPGESRLDHSTTLTPAGDQWSFGGWTCDGSATCAALEDNADTSFGWTPVQDAWESTVGGMAKPRGNHTATQLPDGRILVAGGTDGPSVLSAAELYNPQTQIFSLTGEMNRARDLHSASILPNGKVLVAGGFSTDAVSTGATNGSELYYPNEGVWRETGVMTSSRDSHAAINLPDGNILVFGGYNRGVYLDSAEIYYSTVGVWRDLPAASAAVGSVPGFTTLGPGNVCNGNAARRAKHTATLLKNGEILIVGGVNGDNGVLNSSMLLNLFNGSRAKGWYCTSTPPGRAVHSHTAILMPNGRVVVSFGNDGEAEAEFPPLTRVYTHTNDATGAGTWANGVGVNQTGVTFNHTATLMPTGVILIAGGARGRNSSQRSTFMYDVLGSTYGVAGRLGTPRAWHTTTLTNGQTVIAIGGYDAGSYLRTAEFVYFSQQAPDYYTRNYPPSVRLSTVASISPSIALQGDMFTVRDRNLTRMTEAAGGGTESSVHWQPRMILQALDPSGGTSTQGNSSFYVDMTTRVYHSIAGSTCSGLQPYCNRWTSSPNIFGSEAVNSSITVRIPEVNTAIPNGWYQLRLAANAQFSDAQMVRIGPPLPLATAVATGTVVSTTSIFWTWPSLGAGTEGYTVFFATSGVYIATRTPPTAPNSVEFLQTGLTPNVTACILVSGFSMTGDGPLTSAATTFTLSTVAVNVGFSTIEVNSVSVQWDANGNSPATVYELSMSTDDPSTNGKQPFTTSFSTPTNYYPPLTTTYLQVSGLVENTTYWFRVRAQNLGGVWSNFSSVSSATTRANVYGLQGGPCPFPTETYCIRWSWNNVPIATKYRIYNATVAWGSPGYIVKDNIANSANPFFEDIPLATATSRTVRVSAFTPSGEGPLCNSVTIYTWAAMPALVNPPMTTDSTGTITVIWNTNGNPIATKYRVYYATMAEDGNFRWESTTTVQGGAGGTMSSRIQQLLTSQMYVASVTALNDANVESYALSVGATSTWAATPTNLRVTGTTPDSVILAWDANGNTSSTTYQVTYSTDDNREVPPGNGKAPFSTVISTSLYFSQRSNALGWTASGLSTGKKYWFRVQAQNIFGIINPTFTIEVSTITTTGSAAAASGSLGGVLKAVADSSVSGTIGNPAVRTVTISATDGSLTSPVTVVISSFAAGGGGSLCSNGLDMGVRITLIPPLQPIKPLTFTMTYSTWPVNELAGYDTDTLVLMRYDEAKGKCVPMPTSVDTVNLRITALLNHLSQFQMASVVAAKDPHAAKIWPNPFYKKDGYVTFSNMPAGSRVRIYTLLGDLVYDRYATATGILTWGGLNQWGRTVASGTYLVAIQHGDDKKILKLVVLR